MLVKQINMKGLLKTSFIFILALSTITILSSCTNFPSQRYKNANKIAIEANFNLKIVKTDNFLVTTYSNITNKKQPLNIYIEGDGLAWINRHQISNNPTPVNPLALKLASKDPSKNILYISRPCQFNFNKDNSCNNKYWSKAKFSKEVIKSINQVISDFKVNNEIKDINLIGFSGGGAVAILITVIRDDIKSIRTIAGNLDHIEHSKHHNVSQLDMSLNPIDYVDNIKNIPQIHFVGEKDKVVPPYIALIFAKKAEPDKKCIRIEEIKNTTHENGWLEKWQTLLAMPLVCN